MSLKTKALIVRNAIMGWPIISGMEMGTYKNKMWVAVDKKHTVIMESTFRSNTKHECQFGIGDFSIGW